MEKYKYTDYINNSKKLLKLLFGNELYKKLDKTKLKSIDWDGIDLDVSSILATTPSIKERFNEDWIEYYKERDYTLLDLYLQTVFHYGYQQCEHVNKKQWDILTYFETIKSKINDKSNPI